MTKKIDLHVHSRLSKSFDYDHANLERLVRLGRRRGLDAFALTEHIHAVNFWDMHTWLLDNFEYERRRLPRRRRLHGALRRRSHGRRARRLHRRRPARPARAASTTPSARSSPNGTTRRRSSSPQAARERGLVLILAHPFRVGKEAAKLDERIFDLVHAVEVNGRDHGGERQVVALAEQHEHARFPAAATRTSICRWGFARTIVPQDDSALRCASASRSKPAGRASTRSRTHARSSSSARKSSASRSGRAHAAAEAVA